MGKTYEEMIKRGGEYIYHAANRSSENSVIRFEEKARGFGKAISMMFDVSENDVWNDMLEAAHDLITQDVLNGDRRAENRWGNYMGFDLI